MNLKQKLREKNKYSEIEIQNKIDQIIKLSKMSFNSVKKNEIYHNLDDDDLMYLQELIKDRKLVKGYLKDITRKLKKNDIKNTKKAIDAEDFLDSIEEIKKTVCKITGIEENYDSFKSEKIIKSNGYNVKSTEKWKEYKKGTGEKSSKPKTDRCLTNKFIKKRISLKLEKGRYTSSDCFETNAIFRSVIDKYHKNDLELIEKINEIISKMNNLGKIKTEKGYNITKIEKNKDKLMNDENMRDSIEWINKFRLVEKELNKIWNDHIINNEEFVKNVLFECVSGKIKFGEDNIGRADWLIIIESSDSIKVKNAFNLKERTLELDNYLINSIPKNPFKGKSSDISLWCRFL